MKAKLKISESKKNLQKFKLKSTPELRNSSTSTDPCDTIATDGIDINQVKVPIPGEYTKMMTWDCWDYAGQEVYYSTHQFFLSPRSVYLICFNLLDRDLSKVEYWLNSVHTRARGSPILLVGTHVDDKACTEEYVDEYIDRLMKTIKPERYKNAAGKNSVKGIHALSSKKRIGIRELMEDITNIIIKSKFVGKLYPNSWLKLEQTLCNLKFTGAPFLSWKDFVGVAIGTHIDKNSVEEAAKFFHLAGILCYFGDKYPKLKDFVILNPQFLANVMSALITLKHSFGINGLIKKEELHQIWKEFSPEIHQTLMDLLQKFEITYCIDRENQTYLVPCLLSLERPKLKRWKITPNQKFKGLLFGRLYRFSFMPMGFFGRLIVRNLEIVGFKSLGQWQNGQLLKMKNDNILCLLRYNPSSYTLHLQIHADKGDINPIQYSNSVKALRLITENIETTIEGWYETTPIISVPCSHCLINGYSQWEFPINELMNAVSSQKVFVLCNNVRKIRIDILAPDLAFADLKNYRVNANDIKFEKDIGEGTFGAVFKGKYKNNVVAVKELLEESNPDSDRIATKFQEFKREVWLLSCMKHPNVCSLLGICLSPLAIIMELMPVGDLFRILSIANAHFNDDENLSELSFDDPLLLKDIKVKIRIAYDIANGMNYLHSFEPPIIHRDLRSPNIFINSLDINSNVCARIGDFGLSRISNSNLAGGTFNRNWLAPEVMKGDPYSLKMDVYSFGIILWELLSLEPPFIEYNDQFEGKPKNYFADAIVNGLRPTIPDNCPLQYKLLIENCWITNPKKRYSFSRILEELKKLMEIFEITIPNNNEFKFISDYDENILPASDDILLPNEEICIANLKNTIKLSKIESINSMIKVGNNVWCSCGGYIQIYNISNYKLENEILITEDNICSMININNIIMIGTSTGKIYVYSNEYKRLFIINDHSSAITTMLEVTIVSTTSTTGLLSTLWSADIDGNIYVYKKPDKKPKLKHKLKLDKYIGCMLQTENIVLVGTENDILALSSESLSCVSVWKGHKTNVSSIVSHHNRIWSCSCDGSIFVWDFQFKDNTPITGPLTAHSSRIFCLLSFKGYIFAGSFDKTISVWDPEKKILIQELRHHKDGISSLLAVSQDTFWSGTLDGDGTIGVWSCLKTEVPLLIRLNRQESL